MAEEPPGTGLDRRQLIGGGLGLTLLPLTGLSLAACSAKDTAAPTHARSFTPARMAIVARVADLVLPDTDTPGAVAVGVPDKMDEMFREWASDETRAAWTGVIDAIDTAAGENGFLALSPEAQFSVLEAYDAANIYEDSHPWRGFKAMIVDAYYATETGATEELRFELVPGEWRACVPLEEIGRAWYQ